MATPVRHLFTSYCPDLYADESHVDCVPHPADAGAHGADEPPRHKGTSLAMTGLVITVLVMLLCREEFFLSRLLA